jgi:cytochrome P450
MHKKYGSYLDPLQACLPDSQLGTGPIVRIRPDVLHMNDPEYIDPILGAPGKRRDKYKVQLNGAGAPLAAFGTEHHELHRRRRAPLNPFFSKQSIRRLEPVLHRCLEKILGRLARNAESGEPMKMNMLFNATTSDIISDYCFGESYNNLDKEDLNEPYFLEEHDSRLVFHFATFNPWLLPVVKTLPQKVAVFFIPGLKMFLEGMKVKEFFLYKLLVVIILTIVYRK